MEPITLTLSSVGQITIPRSIRKLLGLEKGTKLDVEVDRDAKTITLTKQRTFDEVMAEIDALHKKYPTKKPDPKYSKMSVGEIALENIKYIKEDTWV